MLLSGEDNDLQKYVKSKSYPRHNLRLAHCIENVKQNESFFC